MEHCKEASTLHHPPSALDENRRRTLIVILISLVTMIAEVIAGTLTGSMSLLADGWHMGSHVAALLLSYVVYRLAASKTFHSHFTFGSAKLYSLGGFTSAIGLAIVAVIMAYESTLRFFHPVSIEFNEALLVCAIGLIVNLGCALILRNHDHDEEGHDHDHHHDHNHQSAMAHIFADALTSLTALVALLLGKYFQLTWLDPLIGIAGSAVILKWAYSLIKTSAYELLDGKLMGEESEKMIQILQENGDEVVDLHIWSMGAGKIAAIASLRTDQLKGSQHYHEKLEKDFSFSHLVVEEMKKP